jgi:hypothetical protein
MFARLKIHRLRGQRKVVRKLSSRPGLRRSWRGPTRGAVARRRPRSRILGGCGARRLLAMGARLPTRALDRVWAIGMGLT